MPRLTDISSGLRSGTEFVFDRSVVVGRGPMADLSLDHPSVSHRHAMLRWVDNECWVVDLDSRNGTSVNNRPISEPTQLRDRDVVGLGLLSAVYRAPADSSLSSVERSSVRIEEVPTRSNVLLTIPADPAKAGPRDDGDVMSRRVRFWTELGNVMDRPFDKPALLSFVLDELFNVVPQAERSFIMLWDRSAARLVPAVARTRSGRASEIPVSLTILNDVTRKREAVLVVDSLAGDRDAASDTMIASRIRSAICVPILFQNEIYGAIQVDTTSGGMPFGHADMSLLVGVATQVGMSLAHADLHARAVERELLEQDMMLARRVQRLFLPQRIPKVPGYSFSVDYSPALEVGGDLYDFLDLPDGRLGIAVGDVSGKGVSAALYVAKLSADVRYLSVDHAEPAEILTRVNQVLVRGAEEGMFVTLVLMSLDPARGEIVVSSAGHLLPFVRNASGQIRTLGRAGGAPLGLSEKSRFEQQTYQLQPSDSIVLYTDGVTEAVGKDQELFGERRFCEAIQQSDGSTDGIIGLVLPAVRQFIGDEPQSDDITVLCVRRDAN